MPRSLSLLPMITSKPSITRLQDDNTYMSAGVSILFILADDGSGSPGRHGCNSLAQQVPSREPTC